MNSSSAPQSSIKYKGARRRIRIMMLFLILFIGWAAATLWDQIDRVGAKNSELEILEAKLEEVQLENEAYHLEIERLNDPEYIEQRIRKDLQMTREGETLFIQSR